MILPGARPQDPMNPNAPPHGLSFGGGNGRPPLVWLIPPSGLGGTYAQGLGLSIMTGCFRKDTMKDVRSASKVL